MAVPCVIKLLTAVPSGPTSKVAAEVKTGHRLCFQHSSPAASRRPVLWYHVVDGRQSSSLWCERARRDGRDQVPGADLATLVPVAALIAGGEGALTESRDLLLCARQDLEKPGHPLDVSDLDLRVLAVAVFAER